MSQSVTYSVSQSLSGRVANKRNDIRLIDVHTPTNQLIDRFNERFAGEREQRMCVVCQEREKTTLLMPCRHLCLCSGCAARTELKSCPLCRCDIVDRIPVYS